MLAIIRRVPTVSDPTGYIPYTTDTKEGPDTTPGIQCPIYLVFPTQSTKNSYVILFEWKGLSVSHGHYIKELTN